MTSLRADVLVWWSGRPGHPRPTCPHTGTYRAHHRALFKNFGTCASSLFSLSAVPLPSVAHRPRRRRRSQRLRISPPGIARWVASFHSSRTTPSLHLSLSFLSPSRVPAPTVAVDPAAAVHLPPLRFALWVVVKFSVPRVDFSPVFRRISPLFCGF